MGLCKDTLEVGVAAAGPLLLFEGSAVKHSACVDWWHMRNAPHNVTRARAALRPLRKTANQAPQVLESSLHSYAE